MIVVLRDFGGLVPLEPSDGEKGVLVRLHWSRWILFWVVAPVMTVGIPWTLYLLVAKGVMAPWGWTAIALYALGVYGVTHVGPLWYRVLSQRFLLFTQGRIYDHRIEHWFRPVTDSFELEKASGFRFHVEGLGILGVRSVHVQLEGDAPADENEDGTTETGILFKHAGGGKALEREIRGIEERSNL